MYRTKNEIKCCDVAFLYERLSRDDELDGESNSIANQKKLLAKVAKEKGYTKIVHFFDDGISGVTMDRPEFNRMMEQLELGKASAVFVKDLSRLGRNYIEVGRLTEEFFPEHNIRLVSVSDNLDTDEGENDLTPIRNLFNEWYARDISKKRRISNKIKGSSGLPLGPPPYGYIKDSDNPNCWIIDEEAANVVRKIFEMYHSGLGTFQIAVALTEEKVLTPSEYAKKKGIKKAGGTSGKAHKNPYHWGQSTVIKILTKQEYCGDLINFKTYSKSYKNKKRYINDADNMLIFKDVHTPIIDRELFEEIQLKRGKTRKRPMANGEKNMFSGLLVCSDCGSNLNYHLSSRGISSFCCPGSNQGKRKECLSAHYVRMDFLEEVVLAEIRRLTRFAGRYEDLFIKTVSEFSRDTLQSQISAYHTECCYSSREVICNNTLFLYFVLLSCCRRKICKIYSLAGVHYNIRLRYWQLRRNINSAHTVIIYNQSLRSYSLDLFRRIYHYLLNQFGKHIRGQFFDPGILFYCLDKFFGSNFFAG